MLGWQRSLLGLLEPAPTKLHCSPAGASDSRWPDQAMVPEGTVGGWLHAAVLLPLPPLPLHPVGWPYFCSQQVLKSADFCSQPMMKSAEQCLSFGLPADWQLYLVLPVMSW